MPHLSCQLARAAPSASVLASLISASTMISLRTRADGDHLGAPGTCAGLALSSCRPGRTASGAMISTASRGRARAVGFDRQAGLDPGVAARVQVAVADQALRRRWCSRRRPRAARASCAAHLVGQLRIGARVFQVLDQQGVTAHLAVVVHAVAGVLGGKRRPSRGAGPAAAASRCAGGLPGSCRRSAPGSPASPARWPRPAGPCSSQ